MHALIVGLHPDSLQAAPMSDPVTAARVQTSMDAAVEALASDGVQARLFLLTAPTRASVVDLQRHLAAHPADAVMIGVGVRLEPALTWYFEALVDAVRVTCPTARLCFNEDPESMAAAVRRVLLGDDDVRQ